MDEQRVVIIVQSQPAWVSIAHLFLMAVPCVAVTFFILYCTFVCMRVLEGLGGP